MVATVTVPLAAEKVLVARDVQLPFSVIPKLPVEDASKVPASKFRLPFMVVVAPNMNVSAVPSALAKIKRLFVVLAILVRVNASAAPSSSPVKYRVDDAWNVGAVLMVSPPWTFRTPPSWTVNVEPHVKFLPRVLMMPSTMAQVEEVIKLDDRRKSVAAPPLTWNGPPHGTPVEEAS